MMGDLAVSIYGITIATISYWIGYWIGKRT